MLSEKERYFRMFIIEKDEDKISLFLNDPFFEINSNEPLKQALMYSTDKIIELMLNHKKIQPYINEELFNIDLSENHKFLIEKVINNKKLSDNLFNF